MTEISPERRLAAIVAADVVGYSRLMGTDETGTLARLTALRQDFIEPQINAYGGRIVKLMGDGILADFPSVVDALACAVEVQRAIAKANESLAENQKIQFRIGINLGDIIVQDDDIFGDGVNIAARLEPLAEPDGICISQTALDAVGNKLTLDYEDIGTHEVKNIAKPVQVYRVRAAVDAVMPAASGARREQTDRSLGQHRSWLTTAIVTLVVVLGGVAVWLFFPQLFRPATEIVANTDGAPALPDKPSIAVLPFTNMSDDPEQEYLSDGITEDLITDLSRLRDLFVIARNSSFVYKGKAVDVRHIGRELGVSNVLEGSVRRIGDQIRITAQLIDAASGDHLWAERYDGPFSDIFILQDDIRQKIVASLDIQISEGEQARVWRQTTSSEKAYELFLQGRELHLRLDKESTYRSIELLEQAVELDPEFAAAWTWLGWNYTTLGSWATTPEEKAKVKEKALMYADRAIDLNLSLGDPHAVKADVYSSQGDSVRGLKEARKAVELSPQSAKNAAILAILIANIEGKPKEALAMIQKAMRFNPHSPDWYLYVIGKIYLLEGQYEEAITILKKCAARLPGWMNCHYVLTLVFMEQGQQEEAQAVVQTLLQLNPQFTSTTRLAFSHPEIREHHKALLIKAGLPE